MVTSLGQLLREKLDAEHGTNTAAEHANQFDATPAVLLNGILYTEDGRGALMRQLDTLTLRSMRMEPVWINGERLNGVSTCWAVNIIPDYEDSYTEYYFSKWDASKAFARASCAEVSMIRFI